MNSLTPNFTLVHDPFCNCFDCAYTPVDGVIANHADAVNPIGVQVGDIIKIKSSMDVGKISGGTKNFPKDTVFVNAPVTKVTPNAVYLGDSYYIRKDANYIVVDSTKGVLRQLNIVTSNQTATVTQPAKVAYENVKEGISSAIDSSKNFLSGLGSTLKWVLVAIIIIGLIIIFAQVKGAVK